MSIRVITMNGEAKFQGDVGPRGPTGPQGPKGDKPIVGVDYFTDDDKEQIVEEVIRDSTNNFNQNAEKKIREYNENAEEKLDTYNKNATEKLNTYNDNHASKMNAYNDNHTDKMNTYDDNATEKLNEYNTNSTDKTTSFNNNATSKTTIFNTNAEQKTADFNENATEKTNTFDTNVEQKTTAYNTNAEEKTTSFNENAESKTNSYNENAEQKTTEFNDNYTEKLARFNDNAEQITADIEELQNEVVELQNEVVELESIVPTEIVNGEAIYIDNAKNYKMMGEVVDGKYEQETTTGRQLFDASVIPSSTGIEVSNNGKTIKMPVATSGNGWKSTTKTLAELCPTLTVGDSVTLKFTRNLSSTVNRHIHIVTPNILWSVGASLTITQEMLDSIVALYANKYSDGETSQCILTDFGIYKSTETDMTWEKYTGGQSSPNPDYKQEITQVNSTTLKRNSANLYNYRDRVTELKDGITVDDEGWITITGDNTAGTKNKYYNYYTNNLDLKTDTDYNVVLEVKKVSGSGLIYVNSRLAKAGQFITSQSYKFKDLSTGIIKNIIKTTMSSFENTNSGLRSFVEFDPGESGSITFRLSVLKDTSITADTFKYEPFERQSISIDLQDNELCAVSDTVKDKLLIDKNGNVAIEKNVEKIVLDGSENWQIYATTYGFDAFRINVANIKSYAQRYLICDNFISVLDGVKEDNRISNRWNNYFNLEISYTKCSTVAEFKTWLSEHNTTVYYKLAIPQIINLPKLTELPRTFEGINHIWVETNVGTTNIEVEYVEDLQKEIEKIKNAIVALGGV